MSNVMLSLVYSQQTEEGAMYKITAQVGDSKVTSLVTVDINADSAKAAIKALQTQYPTWCMVSKIEVI